MDLKVHLNKLRQSIYWAKVFARVIGAVIAVLIYLVPSQVRGAERTQTETYDSATIDADGHLVIAKSNGQRVTVRKEKDQTGFSDPVISSARNAVAAQALFPNCCTSYDIPLQLLVFAAGKAHRFTGVGLPIFQWGFLDGGTRVAYGQETVHFSCATHYELRDIRTERLIEAVDVPQPCGQYPDPKPVKLPDWVVPLISKR